jgi:nucleoside-diphosphate-sugar epimerase
MPDIALGLATLGEREEALGHDWLLPVAPARTTQEVCELVGTEIGQPIQIFNAASLEEAQQAGILDPTFVYEYKGLFYQYTEPQIVDSSAFERIFGVGATAMDEGIRATVEWYRRRA